MNDIARFRYDSGRPGPHILMTGAVHGDEPCGTIALARLRLELDAGLFTLARGRLTLAPIANPAAYVANQRFIEANLNRIMAPQPQPRHQEDHYAAELMQLTREADVLLDLHSYSAGVEPFVFLDYPTPENHALMAAQGITHCVTGWPELYAADAASLTEGDTVSYANDVGKSGVLVECGRHDDPNGPMIGYRCARRTLAHFGMLPFAEPVSRTPLTITRVISVIPRARAGRFVRPWQHLDSVSKGEALIRYDDGGHEEAPFDGFVLLPNAAAAQGAEWLYLGKAETVQT